MRSAMSKAAKLIEDEQLQRMLGQEYQHRQLRSKLHLHTCQGCDVELTCCCADRRALDRVTGEPRAFYCVSCQEYRNDLLTLTGADAEDIT